MSIGQKLPLAQSLNKFAQSKISDAMQVIGKNLPASVASVSGSVVTVNFEVQSGFVLPQVTIPVASSEYVRLPLQVGCKGVVMAMDARIGNMSGLGVNSPSDLTEPGNLSALIFVPIGNTDFFNVPGNQTVIYGPNGVILANSNMTCEINLTSTGIAITVPSGGDVVINGVHFLTHEHQVANVQTGSATLNTGHPF